MLKVGIVGCGSIFTVQKAYYDYKEMPDTEEPAVVHVCVHHCQHPIISRYAIERDKIKEDRTMWEGLLKKAPPTPSPKPLK